MMENHNPFIKTESKQIRPLGVPNQIGVDKMVTNANYRESITGRRVAVVMAIAVLLLGSLGLYSLNSTAINISEVIISADPVNQKVENGETAWYTITLDNTDSEYDFQPVQLEASFQSGDVWDNGFSPTPGSFESLAPVLWGQTHGSGGYIDDAVKVPKGSSVDVYFWVNTTTNGHLLGERTIQVMGYDNWGFLTQGANVTKDPNGDTLQLKLTSVKAQDATMVIDDVNSGGNINVIQGTGIQWGFTVVNAGCFQNTFSFGGGVYIPGNPSPVGGWSFVFAGGNQVTLPGACSGGGGRAGGANTYDTSVTITPPDNAAAGQYELELRITGTNVSISKRADAIIPLPDFVIEPGDVEFSHGAAWVNRDGTASQEVTITVTVSNNGGNRDSAGRATDHVDVDFVELNNMVDMGGSGSSSKTKYIESLKNGEEQVVTMTFIPNKGIQEETDLIINILVDMFPDPNDANDLDIGESNSDNNDVTVTFKLVPSTTSSPGFNVGFIALLGVAVVLAGMASRYRRHKDDEDEE